MNLQVKVAIVTGASSGFGRALATRIIGKGAKVILAGNDIKDGERLADELNSGKDAKVAHFAQCDVTNYSQQAEIFKAAETYFGRVDIVVNNVDTRLDIQALKKHECGETTINTTSLAGLYPQPMTPIFSAAKFGVINFMRSFKDFGYNIRVNTVAPRQMLPLEWLRLSFKYHLFLWSRSSTPS
ncbi:hypothetical protein BC939DRAFT_498276 [Gamsiella multidivaricata]|uniref:uncharacterized protein n=1 Tax=Gamsiella multidivaricata TaxID=101098 RepID=UPI0022203A00|nr:uncharacterized protein BC939DRAFT_498276 [Gamsiella multidivaricata]KAI7832181.1 hypothetical protein BC939DRAFT_498276 [Gamsiella multidivaricata]